MNRIAVTIIAAGIISMVPGAYGQSHSKATVVYPPVSAVPDSVFELIPSRDRDAAKQFYTKYIDVKGLPVLASKEVADLALQRTYEIVTSMLAGRPDVLKAMAKQGMYLIIIGKNQVYTDMPEYRNTRNPDFQNERVRGTGGLPTSFGEENLLNLPLDRYDDESIGVHEFSHTIDSTLSRMDRAWSGKLNTAYRNAVQKGLFKGTYAGSNSAEYWAENVQVYFNCNRVNNYNHGPIGRRDQFKIYDPVGYELVKSTFNLSPEQDWSYTWLNPFPNIVPPPAKFNINPYYTKFTWAREFTVLGRQATDEAMLKVNETIRRLFAYRHDILKALIADGVKMAVLGHDEQLSDLPEYEQLSPAEKGAGARYLGYYPQTKLLVVDQENVMSKANDMYAADCQVIRVMASAIYHVTGTRPVDPEWENRPRNIWQQYELNVQRMDVRFDEKLKEIYENALSQGKWKGTPAINSRVDYWTMGLLAYFDAVGLGTPPNDAERPIKTREQLKEYDLALYELVDQTMAYNGKVDWRYY
ncbi:MAG: hypothetical protein JW787_06830 [Sedimentisphaerales bacterium]|nr:hypothetical protein [Sedimentisphaerales bacterium]